MFPSSTERIPRRDAPTGPAPRLRRRIVGLELAPPSCQRAGRASSQRSTAPLTSSAAASGVAPW